MLPTRPRMGHNRRPGHRVRGAADLRRPRIPPARHRPPRGLPPGRLQPLPARAGTRHGERRLGTRLGLHGRDDRHQTPQDRVRSLAGVTARPGFIGAAAEVRRRNIRPGCHAGQPPSMRFSLTLSHILHILLEYGNVFQRFAPMG